MNEQKQIAEAIENLEATGILSPVVAEFATEFFADLESGFDPVLLICSLQGLAQGTYQPFEEYVKRYCDSNGGGCR